jgi:hypothetical protein
MKSTNEQLKNRGFAFDDDIKLYKNYNENELLTLLQDKEAYKRTIAIQLLSKYNKENYIKLFCETLKTEKKLYTKIELCTVLENYKEKAIPYLMSLLGTIGKNQHKEIEIIDLDKKSYPLPRDIVGRILIRIGPKVFPEINKLLAEDKNINQIYEAIDVIGHITWNYKDYSMENTLLEYYKKHKDNEFIEWKIVRAFQSFISNEIKNILEKIITIHKNETIKEEAKRSIKRWREKEGQRK